MSHPEIQAADVEGKRRFSLSAIWLVPFLAVVVGAAVVWQTISTRGPTIEIRFDEAKGIKPGKTEIKHKDVVIGLVDDVRFSEDMEEVIVTAELDRELAPYLGDTTSFWVVGATVSGADLSGLGTLLSGSYIEVDWASLPSQSRRRFVGLAKAPLTPPGVDGLSIKLASSAAGAVNTGSPIYYRGINVGRVESRSLSTDFRTVEYSAFIEAPYSDLIDVNTRFWNVSGVSLESRAEGFRINLSSVDALFSGGLEFAQFGTKSGSLEQKADHTFLIFENRASAQESQFTDPGQIAYRFSLVFEESVNGLEPGAPVEWQGIRIGTVSDLQLDLSAGQSGETVKVVIELQPSRLGLTFDDRAAAMNSLDEWVRSGMRVRLATGNILTGKKLVRFVDGIGDSPTTIDFEATPYPRLPTTISDLDAAADNAESFVATLSELPLADLVETAIRLLDNANNVIADPEIAKLPGELNQTLSSFDEAVSSITITAEKLPTLIDNLNLIADSGDAVLSGLAPDSQMYVDLANTVRELRDASRSLSALASRLEEQPNALIMGRK